MTDSVRSPSSILVDVELPEPMPPSPTLVDLFASLHVVLVGWYVVPEQTSPEQARDQFEDEARTALDSVARSFEEAGATVTSHLVFTRNKLDTISRISTEEECDAVLIPTEMAQLERILVPLRGLHNAPRTAALVADLVQNGTTDVTLLHVLEEEETEATAREHILQPMADTMTGYGIDTGLLHLASVAADDPGEAITERAADYDIVVIGETKPSVQEILFGSVPEQIVESVHVPVVVVRQEQEAVEMAERPTQTE